MVNVQFMTQILRAFFFCFSSSAAQKRRIATQNLWPLSLSHSFLRLDRFHSVHTEDMGSFTTHPQWMCTAITPRRSENWITAQPKEKMFIIIGNKCSMKSLLIGQHKFPIGQMNQTWTLLMMINGATSFDFPMHWQANFRHYLVSSVAIVSVRINVWPIKKKKLLQTSFDIPPNGTPCILDTNENKDPI